MTSFVEEGSPAHRDQGREKPEPPGQAVADGDTPPAAEGRVRIRFLGSGDNFGSGGRFQTCIHVEAGGSPFLIDCGASSLIPMKRAGIRSDRIDLILISHLHGDHFGGIPFFLLDAQLISRREVPLRIAGPAGLTRRVREAMEVFYPGSSGIERKFAVEYLEIREGEYTRIGDVAVLPVRVIHGGGAPSWALRVESAGKVIAYSGDTEWTDALLDVAHNADLFICECYAFEKAMRNHLNYRTLMEHRHRLGCKRLILTHMGEEMLNRLGEATLEAAQDGMEIAL